MNILFIYDAPLRPEAGGTERATSLVMDELSHRGHNCYGILHFDQLQPETQFINGKKIDSLYEYLLTNKIEVVVNQIAFHPRFLQQFLTHGGQRWKDEGGKIISFMHLDPTPGPRKSLKSLFYDWSQRSIVGKVKRLLYIFLLPFFYYKIDREYRKGLRYLYDTSDRYVLLSESFIPSFKLLARLSEATKVRIIPNMLTFPYIEHPSIIASKEDIVLIVARLDDEQKNISFMLDAWHSVEDHRGYVLHILGDGRDREKLHKLSHSIPDVVFQGSQPPLEWYKKAKVLLMASPREGWGLTITESLQNGVVPIVLNTSTVFKDIINDGENGWLPQNKKDYVKRLSHTISDEFGRAKVAIKGLQSVNRFSPQIVGNLWLEMLKEL